MPPKLATNTLIAPLFKLYTFILQRSLPSIFLKAHTLQSQNSQHPDVGDDGDRHERGGGEEQRPCQAHRRGHGHHVQVVLKNNNFGEVEDCYNIGENFEDYGDFEEWNMSNRDHGDGDEYDEMGMGTW